MTPFDAALLTPLRHMTYDNRQMTKSGTSMSFLSQYQSPETLPGNEAVRLAMLLKIQKPSKMDDLSLADSVARGLSLKSVDAISSFLNTLFPRAIYKIVSEPTLRRARKRKQHKLTRETSERVYEISRVIDQAARVFHGDTGRIRRFMVRPNALLEGKTPFEVASSSSAGTNAVVHLLMEAQAGVAV
ncbi:MAG: antitoxin Xre/MbcA/ParS toxin-binding domain-containing protein [Gammaproteobacteria bacterium]